jgi:hypothetical protein
LRSSIIRAISIVTATIRQRFLPDVFCQLNCMVRDRGVRSNILFPSDNLQVEIERRSSVLYRTRSIDSIILLRPDIEWPLICSCSPSLMSQTTGEIDSFDRSCPRTLDWLWHLLSSNHTRIRILVPKWFSTNVKIYFVAKQQARHITSIVEAYFIIEIFFPFQGTIV